MSTRAQLPKDISHHSNPTRRKCYKTRSSNSLKRSTLPLLAVGLAH
jgi:hypothetical protein